MSASYQTLIETGTSDPEWDSFLSRIENGHHEQSTYWAKVKEHQGWQSTRIKVLKGSEILAGAQILCKRLPITGYVGYISSGPCYMNPAGQSLEILISAINQLAKARKIHYLAIIPYVADDHLSVILDQNGYYIKPERFPPASTTTATLVLDLSKDLDMLFMEMRYEKRKRIKLASKSGLTAREGQRENLETLFRLMSIIAKKRGEAPVPGSVNVFDYIWEEFYPGGFAKLILIESGSDPIAAGFIFTFGKTVRAWKMGWSGELEKKFPTQLLCWEMIKWSKNHGFRFFDIVHVDPVVVEHLSSRFPITDEVKSRRMYGPTLFKLGFGGSVIKFSGPWIRFQDPVIMYLYKYFGPSLLKIPYTKTLISRL